MCRCLMCVLRFIVLRVFDDFFVFIQHLACYIFIFDSLQPYFTNHSSPELHYAGSLFGYFGEQKTLLWVCRSFPVCLHITVISFQHVIRFSRLIAHEGSFLITAIICFSLAVSFVDSLFPRFPKPLIQQPSFLSFNSSSLSFPLLPSSSPSYSSSYIFIFDLLFFDCFIFLLPFVCFFLSPSSSSRFLSSASSNLPLFPHGSWQQAWSKM